MYTHDLLVLGGGAAGLTAASGAAQLGVKVALIDKERLGGDCLYYGCVPSKSLLKSSAVYAQSRDLSRFGLPAVELPRPDLGKVMERVQGVIGSIAYHDSPERFTALGAEVYFGAPQFVSPHEIDLGDGKRLSAGRIIIATGSSPRFIPIPGLKEAGYITNKELFSLKELPPRLLVIGAGPIGVEMSHAFARLGSSVTLIDLAPQILPREDADMAAVVEKRLLADGVKIAVGASIDGVESDGSIKRIRYSMNGTSSVAEGELILLSAGRSGNTGDLGLEKAGVEVEKGFISVDSSLRSSQKHIMAIGDVNGRFLFTHVAGAEGSFAVKKAVLRLPGSMSYASVPWVTYTDPELASVGYNEQRAKEAGISYELAEADFSANDRAQAEGETDGKIKILLNKKGRVIGTQIVGYHAGELLGPHLIGVDKSLKLMEVMGPIYPYPTLLEVAKKAGGNLLAPKLFNPRVRGILKTIFRYRGSGPAPGAH